MKNTIDNKHSHGLSLPKNVKFDKIAGKKY